MVLSFFGIRAASYKNDSMKHSTDHENQTPTGPPPSLWPEPSRPIPIPKRRVQFNTSSETTNRADRALEGALLKRQGRVYSECAVSSGTSTTTPMDSGSTLPSSYSTSHIPSLTPGETAISNVFEPRYPKWFSYPPIHPTEFESKIPTSTPKGDAIDTTDAFLRRSTAFQSWVDKKNAERIQLRYTPDYEGLVYKLHKYQYIADQGSDPAIRTQARQRLLEINKDIAEERKILAPAELQHIRDIEKAWVSLVSIENHEREASRRRGASMAVQVDPTRSLSKVERLLGLDGSGLGISSFTQPPASTLQPTISKTSGGGAEVESTGVNSCDPKRQLVSTGNASSWPAKSYEILIPDWFPVVLAQGNIELKGHTVEQRFIALLNGISQLEYDESRKKYKEKHPDEGD